MFVPDTTETLTTNLSHPSNQFSYFQGYAFKFPIHLYPRVNMKLTMSRGIINHLSLCHEL